MTKKEQIIHYIVSSRPKSGITEVMKLAYLFEVAYYRVNGKQYASFGFIRYTYGPFDDEIYKIISKLTAEGLILTDEVILPSDNVKAVFLPSEKELEYTFDDKTKLILNRVLQETEGLKTRELTMLSYQTEPMKELGATMGGDEHLNERLDISRVARI